jgi:type I restriction enzyme S subunit
LFSSFVDRDVRVCRLPIDFNGEAINKADCFVIRVNDQLCNPSLTYVLAAPATYETMRAGVHGATRPRIGLSQLRSFKLRLPPLAQQKAIVAEVDFVLERCKRVEAEAARARALLDRLEEAILTKAFNGELVPQDPNDEPASVLLERIKAARNQQAQSQPKRGRKTSEPKAPRERAVKTKSRQGKDVKNKALSG